MRSRQLQQLVMPRCITPACPPALSLPPPPTHTCTRTHAPHHHHHPAPPQGDGSPCRPRQRHEICRGRHLIPGGPHHGRLGRGRGLRRRRRRPLGGGRRLRPSRRRRLWVDGGLFPARRLGQPAEQCAGPLLQACGLGPRGWRYVSALPLRAALPCLRMHARTATCTCTYTHARTHTQTKREKHCAFYPRPCTARCPLPF